MNIDINQPRPMEYYAGREWDALQSGKPPEPAFGVHYEMPTEYHERMKYIEKYERRGNTLL